MEQLVCHLKDLNKDLMADIMARLDGSTLAAAACSCLNLRVAARDQQLWERLCHSTWLSTTMEEGRRLISLSPASVPFDKFYADSYPLIFYNQHTNEGSAEAPKITEEETHISPSDFASLVDVYYKKKCVFSKIIEGIDGVSDEHAGGKWDPTASEHQKWFADCPFTLDLLSFNYNGGTTNDEADEYNNRNNENGHHHELTNGNVGNLPLIQIVEEGKGESDFCKKLEEDIRLSWVLLNKKTGKAVNLSSWKPSSVERSWPYDGDYMLRFGSVVSVDEKILPHKVAESVLLVRCSLTEEGCLRWRQISLSVEDITGARISGRKSLMVLSQSLLCLRSINHQEVENGYSRYKKVKREMSRRKESRETLVDTLCLSIEIVVFATLCYICTTFL